MKKVFIDSNGCAVLMHETERIAKYFRENNWSLSEYATDADIVLMTCCGVTQNEEDEAIYKLRQLEAERSQDSKFIVSGCMPSFARDRVLGVSPEIMILRYDELSSLDGIIGASVHFSQVYYNVNPQIKTNCINEIAHDSDFVLMQKIDKIYGSNACERAWEYATLRKYMWQDGRTYQIKVSYGCPGNCSYCATKLGIGNFRSVAKESVMQQFREGLAKGYKRFLLIGDEIGTYGRDIDFSLPKLLREMNQESDGKVTVAIRYIHPDVMVRLFDELKPFFASGFVNYFCCAIQSASGNILKRMNRNPNIEPFIRCMENINASQYPINKHTQIIVGFPGETADDILLTMDALRRCHFDHVNINLYSRRKGTVAWDLGDDVSMDEKKYRAELIRHTMLLHKKALLYDAIKNTMYK